MQLFVSQIFSTYRHENPDQKGANLLWKSFDSVKCSLFQVVIHEVHNQLPTEFSSALCYKKWLRTGNEEGLKRKMGIICFIKLPNLIQNWWIKSSKDSTKCLNKGILFYSHEFLWRKYISMKRDWCLQSNWKILSELWDSMVNIFLNLWANKKSFVFI